jgi:hypothetical protein
MMPDGLNLVDWDPTFVLPPELQQVQIVMLGSPLISDEVFNHTQEIFKPTERCLIILREYLNSQGSVQSHSGIIKFTEKCSIALGEYSNLQRSLQSHSGNI